MALEPKTAALEEDTIPVKPANPAEVDQNGNSDVKLNGDVTKEEPLALNGQYYLLTSFNTPHRHDEIHFPC